MSEFEPEPCAHCKKTIDGGAMRHSLFPNMHFRCALDFQGLVAVEPDAIKLRMKVWTDKEGLRWLVAGTMTTKTSLALGRPLKAYAMRDADVQLIELTIEQYNRLPYSMFIEAERNVQSPGKRQQEVVDL